VFARTVMMWKKTSLLLVCCVATAFAQQVTLKNGDRVSGHIASTGDNKLTVNSAYLGSVTVDLDAVTEISSTTPLVVTRSDHQTASGTLSSREGRLLVETSSGPQEIPFSDISEIRSSADQAAYEESLHPGLLQGWAGGGNLGFAVAKGNSDTTNLSLGFNAARPTPHDKLTITAASLYATSRTNGVSTTSADAFAASLRYDRNITARLFAFGLMAGAYDHAQALDERINPSAGLGLHVIANKITTLDLLGGIGYTYEHYSTGLTNNLINATLGEEFTHKLSASTSGVQDLYFFPDFNQAGNYRANFDFGLASKIYGALTWNLNFADRYVTNPLVGKKNNDVLLTTGIGLSFGAKGK
jgi:putative salt-induced outer membrane protein YdiY